MNKFTLPELLARIAAYDDAGLTVLDMAHDVAELVTHARVIIAALDRLETADTVLRSLVAQHEEDPDDLEVMDKGIALAKHWIASAPEQSL